MIKIVGLYKEFKNDNDVFEALKNINLEINAGEIFGVIGMSGAGKSTLVRCMNLLERPTKGDVIIDGTNLCTLNENELSKKRQSIGMIFQQFNLLMQRSTLRNVTFPLEIAGAHKAEAEKKAKELLDIVGLADKINSYPTRMSGGQKQRVAIARALATNPKVLLCDEATSALDPETTHSILALLKDINKRFGITVVLITHEMAIVEEICTRAAILDGGEIAEVSEVTELFARPKSETARKLIYPSGKYGETTGKKLLRIVFDGASSFEPAIAKLILKFNVLANIMFADTKDIDGKAVGQIIIQVPEDEVTYAKMIAYMRSLGLLVEEVTGI